jgi:sulfofructose kinase
VAERDTPWCRFTLIARELAHYGVDLDGFRRLSRAQSAWSSVTVDPQGERLIVNFPGTGLDVAPDWITPDLLDGSGALLVDMGWRQGAEAAMHLARQLSIPIVLDADLSPDPQTVSLIGLADHVLFSRQALSRLTGVENPEQALLSARKTAARAEIIGVTLGEKGCLLLRDGRFVAVPAFAVNVVDTLGAGDVFHGAYALAIAEGVRFDAATRFANAAAALKCTRRGGRAGIPTRAEVNIFLSGRCS